LKVADTSLVVAAFASWHENHAGARRVLDSGLRLIEHCALETYSVPTRLPAPHRISGDVVREFLGIRFPQPLLRLSVRAYKDFILGLPEHDVSGGAVYDALVAATAAFCGAVLVSCDRRAVPIYERYGARIQILP
jgi:predicted nucleic acid-binding protein